MRRDDPGEPQAIDEAPHILVVDDDARLRTLLERFLRGQDFRVTTAEDADTARRALAAFVFDALILDVMMPGEDGYGLLASLGEDRPPVMMLTALGEVEERVRGLENGVDDYLGKPFEPRELSLRLSNLVRRAPRPSKEARFGAFVFDISREELTENGAIVRLTDRERRLLRLLAARPGATVARQDLVADEDLGDRAIDVQINRLRRKLEADPAQPRYLQTIRGVGYRLVVDAESAA